MNKKFVDLDNRIEYCAMSDFDLELSKYQVKLLNQYIRKLKVELELYKENHKYLNSIINKAIKRIDSIVKVQEITGGVITPTKYTEIKNILQGSDSNE